MKVLLSRINYLVLTLVILIFNLILSSNKLIKPSIIQATYLPPPTSTPTRTPSPTNTPTRTPTPYIIARYRTIRDSPYIIYTGHTDFECPAGAYFAQGDYATTAYYERAGPYGAQNPATSCEGIFINEFLVNDLDIVTPFPTAGFQNRTSSGRRYFGWTDWYTGSRTVYFYLAYNIHGRVYIETSSNPPTKDGSDVYLSNYGLQLIRPPVYGSTITSGSDIPGYSANYILNRLNYGDHYIELQITPTGYQLYPGYTVGKHLVINDDPQVAHFPFVTTPPTAGAGTPSATPPIEITITDWPPPPTNTPTLTPGGPSPTQEPSVTPFVTINPTECLVLPTPVLEGPVHQTCTNVKPTFAAFVNDPNNDASWAHFYSDAYETFDQLGSVQVSSGTSTWEPYLGTLNTTGGYWWTAYTESPSCPRSLDAPANLLNMDFQAPPRPTPPSCTRIDQNLITGVCTIYCTWDENREPTPASCSDTSDYRVVYWTDPVDDTYDTGWMVNRDSYVYIESGYTLFGFLYTKDTLGNISELSDYSNNLQFCPEIILPPSPTIGGPTLTPSPSITTAPSVTPTATLTPTPPDWLQVRGGDVYKNFINIPIPTDKYMQDEISGYSNTYGAIFYNDSADFGLGQPNPSDRTANTYFNFTNNFTYYWQALSEKSPVEQTDDEDIIANQSVPEPTIALGEINIYSGRGLYTLDTSWHGNRSADPLVSDVTIFMITGSLYINNDFSITYANDTVLFIVNGNVYIDGSVENIDGMYIVSQNFSMGSSSNQLTIRGMVYTNSLSLDRTYRSLTDPAYTIIYQPQYIISLIPYLARTQLEWQPNN